MAEHLAAKSSFFPAQAALAMAQSIGVHFAQAALRRSLSLVLLLLLVGLAFSECFAVRLIRLAKKSKLLYANSWTKINPLATLSNCSKCLQMIVSTKET